jgi:hypothetical protein
MRQLASAVGVSILLAAPAWGGGAFDGEWKGSLVVRPDDPRTYVCGLEEVTLQATVIDDHVAATVVDPTGVERRFESEVGHDGRVAVWGRWNNPEQHRPVASLSGEFHDDEFTGTMHFTRGFLGLTCAADVVLRR